MSATGTKGAKRKTPEAPSQSEVDKCLIKVRELAAALRANAHKEAATPSSLGYTNLFEVADNSSEQGNCKLAMKALRSGD